MPRIFSSPLSRRGQSKTVISRCRLGSQWAVTAATVAAAFALAGLSAATGASAFLQYRANRISTQGPQRALADLRTAIRLRPDLAAPRRARAELLLNTSNDLGAARSAVDAALRRDPRDWQSWQLLGSIDFEESHFQSARYDLQQAERYDQGFDGHYQVANFASIMGDRELFWKEITAALVMAPNWWSHYALREITSSASGPNDPGIPTAVPQGRPFVGERMVEAYADSHFWRAAAVVLSRMSCPEVDQIAACQGGSAALVNAAFSAAWEAKNPAQQARLTRLANSSWQLAVARAWLPRVQGGRNLCADGSFQQSLAGPIVGWASVGSVTLAHALTAPESASGSLLIGFDGQEPEQTAIVRQYVPVQPRQDYELSYQSRGESDSGQGGLALEVYAPGWRLLTTLPATILGKWVRNQTTFSVPANTDIVLLSFTYRRPLGQVRLQTPVFVTSVRLAPKS